MPARTYVPVTRNYSGQASTHVTWNYLAPDMGNTVRTRSG